jgi:hypothetical protein
VVETCLGLEQLDDIGELMSELVLP